MFKQLSIIDYARKVKNETGKHFLRQAYEIWKIKQANKSLGATDYYNYRLYDPDYLVNCRPEDFCGWRLQQELSLALNPRNTVLLSSDKFLFTIIAKDYDLPVPRLKAYYKENVLLEDNITDNI